jgi:formylglycine-generating enzyme
VLSFAGHACSILGLFAISSGVGTDVPAGGPDLIGAASETSSHTGVAALRAPGPKAIFIPETSFVMGSDAAEVAVAIEMCKREPLGNEGCEKPFANELDAHPVTLSAYYIDRTEVSVADYRRCVQTGACAAAPFATGGERLDRPDLPVTMVAFSDAESYCRFAGGRVPTEAEWERAARGASGRRFPWGDIYNPRLANHGILGIDSTDDGDGFAELAPVGSFPGGRTPDGIDDLAGNAAEWISDTVEDVSSARYAPASELNPKGSATGALHVVRGGGYDTAAPWLRSAARTFRLASTRRPFIGFRCVHPARSEI